MSDNVVVGIEVPLEKLTRIYIKMREKKAEVAKELEEKDRKSTRLNSSHSQQSRMPSSA